MSRVHASAVPPPLPATPHRPGPRLPPAIRQLKLVGLDWTRPKDPALSLGAASIGAQLQAHGVPHQLRSFAVNDPAFRPAAVVDWALQEGSCGEGTVLCFGAFVWAEPQLQAVLQQLRARGFGGQIVLGGPQVTYTLPGSRWHPPLELLYPEVDVFVRGYGEPAALLLATHSAEQLRGDDLAPAVHQAGVHLAGTFDAGAMAKVELEDLASPLLSGLLPPQPFLRWETQRGCPFRCAFCQHREGQGSFNRKRRQFGMSRVMEEAAWICGHPVISDIAVVDPTFNAGLHYMSVLKALQEGGYRGKLSLQCRFELVTAEFLAAVRNHSAQITLEFGLQTIHAGEAALIQRPNHMPTVEAVMRSLVEAGIHFEASLIYGLPGQTLASFEDSLRFCRRMGVPVVRAWPLMLLRGTPLHEAKQRLGLVESCDVGMDISLQVGSDISHVVASPSFSTSDWVAMWELAREFGG